MGHLVGATVEVDGRRGRVTAIVPERTWAFARPHYEVWFTIDFGGGRYVNCRRDRFVVVTDD